MDTVPLALLHLTDSVMNDTVSPASAPLHGLLPGLSEAIEHGARRLLADQSPCGAWLYGNPMGPRTTALHAVVSKFVGWRRDREEVTETLRWIESWQQPDGSFPAHIRADEGGTAMTATCLAGMAACGREPGDASYEAALAYLETRGGLEKVDPGTRLLLAMSGALDPRELDPNHVFYFASDAVLKPLVKRFNPGAIMFMMALGAVTLELNFRQHGRPRGALWEPACKTIRSFLLGLHSDNGSWFDLPIATCWFVAALHAAGLPSDNERMLEAHEYLAGRAHRDERGRHLVAMDSQVWNTGLALRALCRAGVPEHAEPCQRAAAALRGMQINSPPTPTLFQPRPDAPRRGGWAFTDANPLQADTDDTGVALAGLAQLHRAGLDDPVLVRSLNRGLEWLLGMQNEDGGWAAFACGLPSKKPGALDPTLLMNPPRSLGEKIKLFRARPPEMGDPSTAGLTGRVLFTLGELGFDAGDPLVEEAIAFLEHQRDPEVGGWWGMWMVNWLPATSCVLLGLASVHADLERPWVLEAVAFLEACQNDDGGWGELPESYLDPKQIGRGPSMPALTGLVVQALIAAGRGSGERCRRAIDYILRMQDDDGGWTDEAWLQVVLFPDTLYFNGAHPHVFPLEALCAFRDHLLGEDVVSGLEGRCDRGPALWTDAFLDEMRHSADPHADAVVERIYHGEKLHEVNELLQLFAESDDPIPATLPQVAREYFDATDDLPPWVDEARARFGETTFSYSSWAMVAALFCASLPEAYCAAKGARVLTESGRLERDINKRILETARFILDVMSTEGLESDGRAVRTAQKIRLVHAGVRHLIEHHCEHWDSESLGRPINQEDLAGTLMTFSVVVTEAMRRMRIELTVEQQEAYLYAWRVLGSFLGVREELIPRSTIEGRILMSRIRRRQHRASDSGKELMEALLGGMADNSPFFVPAGIAPSMVRHLIGSSRADMLGVPRSEAWLRRIRKLMRAADRWGLFSGKPPTGDTRSAAGRRKMSLLGQMNMRLIARIVRAKAGSSGLPLNLPDSLDGRGHNSANSHRPHGPHS
jgi:squalene cyclase